MRIYFHNHSSPTSVFCASAYLSRIITSHSAQACDGEPLRLHCPRHSTISIQTAFYGSGAARPCGSDPDPPLGALNRSCSAFTALQVHCIVWDMQHFSISLGHVWVGGCSPALVDLFGKVFSPYVLFLLQCIFFSIVLSVNCNLKQSRVVLNADCSRRLLCRS